MESYLIGIALLAVICVWVVAMVLYRRDCHLVKLRLCRDAGNVVMDAHHIIDPLSLYAVKDLSRHARNDLETSVAALCRLFNIKPADGSELYDEIVTAVFDGSGWAELTAKYNMRTYGTRWPANTRSAKSVV